jgi:hypothetical protein
MVAARGPYRWRAIEQFLCYCFSMEKDFPRIVPDRVVTTPQPSRPLGEHGRSLWNRATSEYDISDVAGVEMLTQACAALDRAEALATAIQHDGEVIRTRTGNVKPHPAIAAELACRGFITRTLVKLGLNFEPLRAAPGRPPGR